VAAHFNIFNCIIETKGLFKVTGSHCKSGNISEMVQNRDVVTTSHCRTAAVPMTLCDTELLSDLSMLFIISAFYT